MPLIPYTPPYVQWAGVYFDLASAIGASTTTVIKSGTLVTDGFGVKLQTFDELFPGEPQIILTPVCGNGVPVFAYIYTQGSEQFFCLTKNTDGTPAADVSVNWIAIYIPPPASRCTYYLSTCLRIQRRSTWPSFACITAEQRQYISA